MCADGDEFGDKIRAFIQCPELPTNEGVKVKVGQRGGSSCCQWLQRCWSGLCCVETWDGTCGSALCCPVTLTECLRDEAGAPAAALAFEELVNETLLLKVKGFFTLLSEEDAGKRVNVEEASIKDEQENLVAGRYSKLFLALQAVLAQAAQCFFLENYSYRPHILGETSLLHHTFPDTSCQDAPLEI